MVLALQTDDPLPSLPPPGPGSPAGVPLALCLTLNLLAFHHAGAVLAAHSASPVCPAGMVVPVRLLVSGCRANGRGRLCRLGANELGATAAGLGKRQFAHVVLPQCHWRHV
jgi:hypothetical protein